MSGRLRLVSVIKNCSCSRGSNSSRQFSSTPFKPISSINIINDTKGKNVVRFDSRRNYASSDKSRRKVVIKKEEDLFDEEEDKLPVASTSAIPYTPPPTRTATSLLRDLRKIDSSSNIPASSIIAKLRDNSESWFDEDHNSTSPPTPPPLIKLDPQPHQPNPHIFAAFLLQMVCLGASALGLMTGRGYRPWNIEGEDDLTQRRNLGKRVARRLGEDDTLIEINLLLTSYSGIELEGNDEDFSPRLPQLSLNETIKPITNLLRQLADQTPNRWTIAALLTFATSPVPRPTSDHIMTSPSSSSSTKVKAKSRYELAQPILIAWAWRAFHPLLQQESPTKLSLLDYNILKAFAQYLIRSSTYYQALEFSSEILDDILNFLLPISLSTSNSNLLPSPIHSRTIKRIQQQPLYLDLIALCLQFDRFDVIIRFLQSDSPLEILPRLKLAERVLSRMSLSKEMSRDTVRVEAICRLFFIAVQDLTSQNSNRSSEINPGAIHVIESGIKSYLTGFTLSIATESLAYEILLHVLKSNPTVPFSETFLTTFFNHFVGARNPTRAFAIFDSLPIESRKLSYYNILMRTYHAPSSSQVWEELKSHPELSPNVESFEARIISHSHQDNNNLGGARNNLRMMTEKYKLVPTLLMKNQLLKILVAQRREKAMDNHWTRVEKLLQEETKKDERRASYNIRVAWKTQGMVGRTHLEKLRNSIMKNENRIRGLKGEEETGSTTDGVTQNIILKVMTKSKEVQSKDLVKFSNNILGIDLSKDIEELDFKKLSEQKVEKKEVDRKKIKNRDFAMKTMIRAFKSRGENQLRNKLVVIKAREKMMREHHKK